MEAVLADLAARFPEGFLSFTKSGKRTLEPNVYPTKTGYTVNINGFWTSYNSAGKLLSAEPHWVGRVLPPRPKRPPPIKHRFAPGDREFIARKIAQIQGRQP